MTFLATTPPWLTTKQWPWTPQTFVGPEGGQHLIDTGENGQPIVFIHGTPTWSLDWHHLITSLQPNHRCIAIDHLGFGLSERPTNAGYRPEDHARRLGQVLDSLNLDQITLVIHDFGGPIALDWALNNPDRIKRLVVLNTWAWSLMDQGSIRWASWLLNGHLGRFLYGRCNLSLGTLAPSGVVDKQIWHQAKADYHAPFPDAQSRVQVLWPLAAALTDSTVYYEQLRERLLVLANHQVDVIWGTQDQSLGLPLRDRWMTTLPYATLTNAEQSGHWPQLEQPELVLKVLSRSA